MHVMIEIFMNPIVAPVISEISWSLIDVRMIYGFRDLDLGTTRRLMKKRCSRSKSRRPEISDSPSDITINHEVLIQD